MVKIYTDGACSGNPGRGEISPASAGDHRSGEPSLTVFDPRGSEAVGLGSLGLAGGLGRLDPRPVLHLGEETTAGVFHHSLRRNGPSSMKLGLNGRFAELGDQAVVRG